MASKTKLFTIGHSTHPLEPFLALLARHRIKALVDIRRFPGSRKFPQFNQSDLASALQKGKCARFRPPAGRGVPAQPRGVPLQSPFFPR